MSQEIVPITRDWQAYVGGAPSHVNVSAGSNEGAFQLVSGAVCTKASE